MTQYMSRRAPTPISMSQCDSSRSFIPGSESEPLSAACRTGLPCPWHQSFTAVPGSIFCWLAAHGCSSPRVSPLSVPHSHCASCLRETLTDHSTIAGPPVHCSLKSCRKPHQKGRHAKNIGSFFVVVLKMFVD